MKALPQSTIAEGLRTLVVANGWEFCILWRLSPDQRFLEWMGCCCGGVQTSIQNGGVEGGGGGGGENMFPVVSASKVPCRDVMFPHPRTSACDALAESPSSIPLDSFFGIHAQVLVSNQPRWEISSPNSTLSQEMVRTKTRVLVPVPGGLVELFVSKHMPEDQHTIEFVISHCNTTSFEQAPAMSMGNNSADPTGFLDHQPPNHDLNGCDYSSMNNHCAENLLPWIPMQPMTSDHPNYSLDLFGGPDSILSNKSLPSFDSTIDNGIHNMEAYQQSILANMGNIHHSIAESSLSREVECQDKDSVKQETGRADSVASDGSDQVDDDEDQRPIGRSGKRHHSKNLVAERKRRKKLNDRLYALRALVPKITKMDRASILGDAIEYVKELQKQVKDLQDDLVETNPEDDGAKQIGSSNISNCQMEIPNPNGHCQVRELEDFPNSSRMAGANTKNTADPPKPNHDSSSNEDKGQQMEVQVEVKQVEGNEFFLKVFCEHKQGGFVKLMEAMSSLGLEVTNANVTTFRGLVLNVFKVEKRDDEVVQADQVRDSLLELTRNPNGGWPEPPTENGVMDFHHNHHRSHHLNSHHHLHYLHHQP